MKNKRILFLFCALLFVVTLVILSSVLFAVSSVEVNVLNSSYFVESNKIEENISSIKGTSILVLSEKELSQQIEKDFTYAKVVSVERVFPSKIIVHIKERYEVFYIKSGENYYHLDQTAKILRISDSAVSSKPAGAITANIQIELPENEIESAEVGQEIILKHLKIVEFIYSVIKYSYDFDEFMFRQYVKKIDLSVLSLAEIQMVSGAKFILNSYDSDLKKYVESMNYIYAEYLNDLQRSNSKINILKNSEGKITFSV